MVKTKKEEKKPEEKSNVLEKVNTSLDKVLKAFDKQDRRMTVMETELRAIKTGRDDRFKLEAKPEDIEKAKADREGIDERIVKIIDETLGEDFGIRLMPNKDRPGFNLTFIVPSRLSLLPKEDRPIKIKGGDYKTDGKGNVIKEEYQPEDRRSKQIASTDNFSAVQDHCERVRANIVATYQKLNKPLPEFRLKTYV